MRNFFLFRLSTVYEGDRDAGTKEISTLIMERRGQVLALLFPILEVCGSNFGPGSNHNRIYYSRDLNAGHPVLCKLQHDTVYDCMCALRMTDQVFSNEARWQNVLF
jgi:hypothetical protein